MPGEDGGGSGSGTRREVCDGDKGRHGLPLLEISHWCAFRRRATAMVPTTRLTPVKSPSAQRCVLHGNSGVMCRHGMRHAVVRRGGPTRASLYQWCWAVRLMLRAPLSCLTHSFL
ncbi:hypothetical protein TRVL_05778 [Trypanosoma vivax]|nr:hypothetical protein TRVL_05778 [Trypanosoma vivax]